MKLEQIVNSFVDKSISYQMSSFLNDSSLSIFSKMNSPKPELAQSRTNPKDVAKLIRDSIKIREDQKQELKVKQSE